MTTNWTPKNLVIVVSGIIGALLILPNLGKGWGSVKYVADAFPAAYAGEATAKAVKSDFDRYIEQQEEALKLEKQRNELQEDYNKKLTEIQQQQIPNQPYRAPAIERLWDEQEQRYYCDD